MDFEICENCKNFVRHYYMNDVLGVRQIRCGHCRELKESKRKRISECSLFEEKSKKEKRLVAEFNLLSKVNYKLNIIWSYIAKFNEDISNKAEDKWGD